MKKYRYYWRNVHNGRHITSWDGPYPDRPPGWRYVEARNVDEAIGLIVEIRKREEKEVER
jgi:hypothetical protein